MNLLLQFPLVLLCGLLALAIAFDIKQRRIPNKLILFGVLCGLLLHANWSTTSAAPYLHPDSIGLFGSLKGLGLGFALLFPIHLLRALGAGDVKLMAMIGSFIGPEAVFPVIVISMFSGGALALIVALRNGVLKNVLVNTKYIVMRSLWRTTAGGQIHIEQAPIANANLPYAVALSSGTLIYILLGKL